MQGNWPSNASIPSIIMVGIGLKASQKLQEFDKFQYSSNRQTSLPLLPTFS